MKLKVPRPQNWWIDPLFEFAAYDFPEEIDQRAAQQIRGDLFAVDDVFPDEPIFMLDVEHIDWTPEQARSAQADLLALLKTIDRRGVSRELRKQLAATTERLECAGGVWFDDQRGTLEPRLRIIFRSIDEWVSFLLAALISERPDLRDRLRKCKYKHCGDYFFAWDNRSHFCCDTHQKMSWKTDHPTSPPAAARRIRSTKEKSR